MTSIRAGNEEYSAGRCAIKIGLVGGSYQERSLDFDSQRTINLIPVADEGGKEVSALINTPGLLSFTTAGTGVGRGGKKCGNGRVFFVTGNRLYETESDGTATSRGTLNSFSGKCTLAENGVQLGICDGTDLYMFTFSSDTFAEVTDGDLPDPVRSLAFIGGYFVVNKGETGQFNISSLYDGTAWDALDFATAESAPDNLVCVVNALDQLVLPGGDGTEIWTNTGAADFPFEKISGGKIEKGCASGDTFLAINSAMVWVGQDENGSLEVYQARGFVPETISTPAIAKRLKDQVSAATSLFAYGYQEDGHTYYVLSGGGMETTLVYDLTTKLWHERSYLNASGEREPHLSTCFVNAFNKLLVGSRLDGTIYEMSSNYYSDDGDEILSERIFQHLSDERQQFSMNALTLDMETGVGNATDANPKISMRMSKDGAHTWTDWLEADMGALGNYGLSVEWRRLGVAEQVVFHIRISSRVKKAIIGAYLR